MMSRNDQDFDSAAILALGSATIYEASGTDCFLDAGIRGAWPGAELVGRALPVLAGAGDNLALHWALALAEPGDVLIVDGGDVACGYFGEVMAVAAQARGIAGLVIDGGVRDTHQLEAMHFPAFSSRIAIRGTQKRWAGTVGPTVTIRGRRVERGDLVVADRDGIAVVPHARVAEVLDAARERVTRETEYIRRLRDGELTLDVYPLRALDLPEILDRPDTEHTRRGGQGDAQID